MTKKFCIFDLDGTLTNTVETIAYFVNSVFDEYGLEKIESELFKKLTGNGARTLIRRALALRLESWSESFENEVLEKYNSAYDNDFLKLCTVYDGVKETVSALKNKGIKLAVLTNKPESTAIKTVKNFFGNSFDMIVGQKEGLALKPSPAGALYIIKEFGFKNFEGLYIGDTATDIETGKSANIFTIGVLWGFRDKAELEAAKANAIISEPSEILEFLSL